ncbi:MAG: hypothetical protein CR997_06915 [Acidobacteria bacterium]|nr:MAG: hypothetical protein CR997_06915 [Acidobacteriota bacterium]
MHHENHTDYIDVVSSIKPGSLSGKTKVTLIVMMLIGFGTFVYQAFVGDQPRIGWIAFLHNFYIFTGLAAAGVLVAAIQQVTNANWGRAIKRFAEASFAFLPVSLVGLVILYFGSEHIFSWVTEPPHTPHKHFWLQKEFLFARDFVALLILTFIACRFVKASLRPDIGLAAEKNPDSYTKPDNWNGVEEEVKTAYQKMGFWGALYCLAFAVVISLLAYDLIMSLDPTWFSAMFGGWNFTTAMLTGWISVYFMAFFVGNRFGLQKYMHKLMYHDAGKLTFGFSVVWAYLFFAQFLVIWYGNLPHEVGYVLTRIHAPWDKLAITVFLMVFIIPFVLGLAKEPKMAFKTFVPILLISMIGIWLERFMLIAPSTWYFDRAAEMFKPGIAGLIISDILVFIGFLGLYLFAYTKYLYSKPVMVISDPKLPLGINRH